MTNLNNIVKAIFVEKILGVTTGKEAVRDKQNPDSYNLIKFSINGNKFILSEEKGPVHNQERVEVEALRPWLPGSHYDKRYRKARSYTPLDSTTSNGYH